MDSDQNVAQQSFQMDSMWKATTICAAANISQTSDGISRQTQSEEILIAY